MSASPSQALDVSLEGLRVTRWTTDRLFAGVKEYYAIGRIDRGTCEWWGRGRAWRSGPRHVQIKEPGDVHRDIHREGPTTWTVVILPANDIERVRDDGKSVAIAQLEPDDERAAPFHRLFDAIDAREGRLTLEVALTEVVNAFVDIREKPAHTRPVRRAMEYLRERLAEPVTLDDLADHANLDKFHLCRAFRAQIGMPPHAYLTRLRIARAKELLRGGVRASEIAPRVGLYDQAQLTRHFRRIVGTTPGRYALER
jgi:AraC-like DNA-binding protein